MSGLKRVFIAEKPKVARAIAGVLERTSPVTERGELFIRGKDWAVSWARGHIFELQEPDYYLSKKFPDARKVGDSGRLAWDRAHLPLVPTEEEFTLRCTNREALSAIRKLVSEAEIVIHAGDPDREGQLVVDAILSELRVRKPVKRYIASGMDDTSVEIGLRDLRNNKDFVGMSDAARARGYADWLVGMNMSRALTLRAQQCGTKGTVPYGRVQTAVLGLIVQRELDIQNFKPVDYILPQATFQVSAGEFKAEWLPKEGAPGLNADGKLVDPAEASRLQKLVTGKNGTVVDYTDAKKSQGAPLPFSLARLQMLASKKFGYSMEETLQAVQSLYDSKLVSYPRTGSQHLPSTLHALAPETLRHVSQTLGLSDKLAASIDSSRKSAAWNDDKAKAHHGIVPLTSKADVSKLGAAERNIYLEICKRYAAQFMPPREYRAVVANLEVEGERFKATGNTTLKPGWRALYGDEVGDDDAETSLPPMSKGDSALCKGLDLAKKRTEPPKRFTDSSLLEAMLNVHKFVSDPKVVAVFKKMRESSTSDEDVGGLGTPATRQSFTQKLNASGLIRIEAPKGKGKESVYHPEPASLALMKSLPADLGKPDTTAVWETVFESIEAGKTKVGQFLEVQGKWIDKTISAVDTCELSLPAIVKPAAGGRRSSSSGGRSFGKRRAHA